MKKFLIILLLTLLALPVLAQQDTIRRKSVVDYDTDLATKLQRGDSTIRMIGNVVFHHNGAIIQCDSAYRYNDKKMDCFGRVIVYQDSTYIYGDKASYNGDDDKAQIFAPMIKLIRGDVTMYTFNLDYNTLTGVAEYWGGATVTQGKNLMESERGYFYSKTDDIKFLNQVALKSPEYTIRTDSAGYNIKTEYVTFLAKTMIWDKDNNFLQSERGNYSRQLERYTFIDNGYVLTKDQELWADTMVYNQPLKEIFLTRNIQILDSVQKTIALGDQGYFNDSTKFGFLTRTPAVLNWEEQKDRIDTAYMRADSIFLYTFEPGMSKPLDSLAMEQDKERQRRIDAANQKPGADSLTKRDSIMMTQDSIMVRDSVMVGDSLVIRDSLVVRPKKMVADSTMWNDSIIVKDSVIAEPPPPPVQPQIKPELKQDRKKSRRDRKVVTDSLAMIRQKPVEILEDTTLVVDSLIINSSVIDSLSKNSPRIDSLKQDSLSQNSRKIVSTIVTDSITVVDSTSTTGFRRIVNPMQDSLVTDSTKLHLQPVDSTASADSIKYERILKAYYNVKMFRKDFQGVCDSLIGFSVDSTMNMIGNAILWNENNQISADQIDGYSKNEQMDWADFIGSPFITQRIDSSMYNQAKGKSLKVYFKNNEIDTAVMDGNVMNYYYMDEKGRIVSFAAIESASLKMSFEKRKPTRMNWIGRPTYSIYPIEKIPGTQSTRLDGFKWEEALRPASPSDITTRIIRPSTRLYMETLRKPEFSLTSYIMAEKAKLIKDQGWLDRSEPVNLMPEYFQNRELY